MSIVLWILQALMAVMFLWHGQMMVAPPAELLPVMNASMSTELRLFIGVAELLAVIGLILPGATRILPWLTTLAGAGLMIVMSSATVLHLMRGETSSAVMAGVIFLIVTFITYGRWKLRPFTPRTFRTPAQASQSV